MSNHLIALMFGAGVGGWVYTQIMRQTGGNLKSSWIITAISGIVAYFVMYTLLAWVLPS